MVPGRRPEAARALRSSVWPDCRPFAEGADRRLPVRLGPAKTREGSVYVPPLATFEAVRAAYALALK